MTTKINIEEDGVSHINIYSQGKTELGRLLSNFAFFAFEHPEHGFFTSIEGLWYWLGVEDKEAANVLRYVYGHEAKKVGRELRGKDWNDSEDFKDSIIQALEMKASHPKIKKLLSENPLPFYHYYVYNGRVVEVKEGQWILDFWNSKTEFKLI